MPSELQYSLEECHEMHKRIILNGVFSAQRTIEAGAPIPPIVMESAINAANKLIDDLVEAKLVKGL